MLSLEVAVPEKGALVKSAERALTVVQAITIDSPEMFEAAGMELRSIKQRIDSLDAQRTNLVKPLNDVVKKLNDIFRRPLGLLARRGAGRKSGQELRRRRHPVLKAMPSETRVLRSEPDVRRLAGCRSCRSRSRGVSTSARITKSAAASRTATSSASLIRR